MIVNVTDQLRVVRIPPVLSRVLPWHFTFDLHAVRQLVENDTFQIRIILHDQADVPQCVLYCQSPLVKLQPSLPAVVFRIFREVFPGLRRPLLCSQKSHLVLCDGKISHGLVGILVLQIPELVDPHNVKCVA